MRAKRQGGLLKDYGVTILIAVVIALLIRFFVIEAYRIPSAAMKPTLEPGDTIFVGKLGYGSLGTRSKPVRGEVIIFSPPGDVRRDYIKRIVAIPGDTVAVRKGRVVLNGRSLDTDSKSNAACGIERFPGGRSYEYCVEQPLIEDFGPEKVPESSVFVLGDFRAQNPNERTEAKRDAPKPRSWGIVPVNSIRGKALWIWLSVERGSGSWFPQLRFNRMLKRVE